MTTPAALCEVLCHRDWMPRVRRHAGIQSPAAPSAISLQPPPCLGQHDPRRLHAGQRVPDRAEVGTASTSGRRLNGRKQPYCIRLQDDQPFAFAGLWERWNRGGDPLDSRTIVTTDANELVGSIHDRMPIMQNPRDYDLWLDPGVQDAKRLEPLLVPHTGEAMAAYPVSTVVNKLKADDAKCVEPAG
jgi:hypothetical protein